MNKRFFLGIGLSLAMAMSGPVAIAQDNAPMKITLAGGSVGGAWSVAGNAVGEILRRSYAGTSFTYEPGREQSNIILTSSGRVNLGIAHAQLVAAAQQGKPPFKKPITNLRGIALIDPNAVMQVFVRKDFGFGGFDSVRSKKRPIRVALNKHGTMMAELGEALLAAENMPVKDIQAWGGKVFYVSFNEGLDMLKNKQADMIINLLAYPSAQVDEATREMPLAMVGISPAVEEKLEKGMRVKAAAVPAKTYDFQPKEVQTVKATVVLFASTAMSDEDAGKVASALLKNIDVLKSAHAMMRHLTPTMLSDTAPLTLHPGAAKVYRAAGLIK